MIRVDMLVKGTKRSSVIKNVIRSLLQCNLYSVRRREDNEITVKIAGGKVFITKANQIVCAGERQGRLYTPDIVLRTSKNLPYS